MKHILYATALALAAVQTSAQTPGDFNSDGKMDAKDVSQLIQLISSASTSTVGTGFPASADLNKDQRLNVADIIMLAKTAGKGAIPEYTVSTAQEAPQWQIDWSYNQQRPDWKNTAKGVYENWTILYIIIEEALQPYASQDDMLAIFVGDEIRGLASPTVNMGDDDNETNASFLLKVWGNEAADEEVNITMKYYCSRLNQIFSLSDKFTVGEVAGIDELFAPPFTLGSAKYPVTSTIDVAQIIDLAGIAPANGDIIGAFVGEECRALMAVENEKLTSDFLNVYSREDDGKVDMKYYQAASGRIFTFNGVALYSTTPSQQLRTPRAPQQRVTTLSADTQLDSQGDWTLTISSPEDMAAWQMKVTLPQGLAIRERKVDVAGARFSTFSVSLPEAYDKNKYLVVGQHSQTDNSYFLFCIPLLKDYTGTAIDNAVGKNPGREELCTIELYATGKGDLTAPQRCNISNIVTSDAYAIATTVANVTNTTVARHNCDTNGDLKVDVADISAIIDAMASKVGSGSTTASDANNDGQVDVADIATVIDTMAK